MVTVAAGKFDVEVPPITLRDITFQRQGRTILDGISLTVGDHERWVVLGPNGSGKTTLLRIMALYEHPTSGVVEVLGGRLGQVDVRQLRRRIGYASAALADQLRPGLTAHEVVKTARYAALEPWWHHYTVDDDRAALRCLERLGVGGFADRTFGSLSSGEQQRVLLARTMMNEPDVVLLDEPSARLDLAGREELIESLADLARDEAAPSLVMVTHHVNEIPPGTTHVLLLRDGRAVVAGGIEELTGEAISACFARPLELHRHDNGRFTAWTAAR